MVKKPNKWTSIVIDTNLKTRLKQARDDYKKDTRNFQALGLAGFYVKLLEFYETNKDKVN